ncbi:MAG: ornithine carbamoyltransferase [Chloroflexota bacterium]
MRGRDLLSVGDLTSDEVDGLVGQAGIMKKARKPSALLAGKTLALIFEKPSLRTRVSFELAVGELGGRSICLSREEVGLGKREPIGDVARVLSRFVDGMIVRTYAQANLETLAAAAGVPVINALSDSEHPCQALADLLTLRERKGKLAGLTIAFVGDGNNVANSLLLACCLVGMNFRIASPAGYDIEEAFLKKARELSVSSGSRILVTRDPQEAARDADAVYTDVWVSMGQEAEAERRRSAFGGYQVSPSLLSRAKPDVLLMHPMPVHYGEELAAGMSDSPASVIFDQAENRLHVQKALLAEIFAGQ